MLEFRIHTLDGMLALGGALAICLRDEALRCILLRGDLGSGKTTLTRFVVEALPEGDRAEISSPSFTLCNVYPTTPPVLHCDLYRAGGVIPDEIAEALDGREEAVIVEWAERLPLSYLPHDFLDIYLQPCDDYRIVSIKAHGSRRARLESLVRTAQDI